MLVSIASAFGQALSCMEFGWNLYRLRHSAIARVELSIIVPWKGYITCLCCNAIALNFDFTRICKDVLGILSNGKKYRNVK
ncbi:MAG: hypothetical protein AAGA60_21550 [Cyanobacteria bacterium P01_E01_bin.42]